MWCSGNRGMTVSYWLDTINFYGLRGISEDSVKNRNKNKKENGRKKQLSDQVDIGGRDRDKERERGER
jgi:hypothetical protein